MKVNSISTYNYSNKVLNPAFKHAAVPYPEYESAYIQKNEGVHDKISQFVNKLADLFKPEITSESKKIKSQIDSIYDDKSAKKYLVSVLV